MLADSPGSNVAERKRTPCLINAGELDWRSFQDDLAARQNEFLSRENCFLRRPMKKYLIRLTSAALMISPAATRGMYGAHTLFVGRSRDSLQCDRARNRE
jgi:hypothetical protein